METGTNEPRVQFVEGTMKVDACKGELTGYETSKGPIRFQPDHPLPAVLVRKLIKARIAKTARPAAKKSE